MKEYTWKDIFKDLRNKVYYPVYFLMGEEPFYIDVISNYIENNVLDETESEFNQTVLYGRETDVPTIISHAKRYPMMANHQVVVVKEAQVLKDIELLESYFQKPLESTLLVICYKYKSYDRRKTLLKSAQSKGVVMHSPKEKEWNMAQWIEDYVKRKGYKIGHKSAQMLADHMGTDLGKVVNEIQKVFISLPKGEEVTSRLIEKNIGISKDFNIFELQNALAEKDAVKAFQIVKYFGDNQKANPNVVTLAVLHSFFVKLMVYHSLKDKSEGNVRKALSLGRAPLFNLKKGAANYRVAKLMEIMAYLREYDLKSKGVDSNAVPGGELLKELVYKILN